MEVRVDSNLIRCERERRGWSQSHLASVAGLSLRTIQRIEKAGSASFESVMALASVLSVEVAELRAKESQPSRKRAIRISLELPLRVALATISGVLVALHFRWSFNGLWLEYESLDYGIAGALFGVSVLCPYLRAGHWLMMRALALVGASALSYYCAIWTLSAEAWLSVAPVLTSFLLFRWCDYSVCGGKNLHSIARHACILGSWSGGEPGWRRGFVRWFRGIR